MARPNMPTLLIMLMRLMSITGRPQHGHLLAQKSGHLSSVTLILNSKLKRLLQPKQKKLTAGIKFCGFIYLRKGKSWQRQ